MELNDNHRRINPEVKHILTRQPESAFEGTPLEGRERRYTVISETDKRKYLAAYEIEEFEQISDYYLGAIQQGRERDKKKPFNTYLVINTDEPYANEIIEVLNRHGHWDEKVDE